MNSLAHGILEQETENTVTFFLFNQESNKESKNPFFIENCFETVLKGIGPPRIGIGIEYSQKIHTPIFTLTLYYREMTESGPNGFPTFEFSHTAPLETSR